MLWLKYGNMSRLDSVVAMVTWGAESAPTSMSLHMDLRQRLSQKFHME